jgi:hypothetical protein
LQNSGQYLVEGLVVHPATDFSASRVFVVLRRAQDMQAAYPRCYAPAPSKSTICSLVVASACPRVSTFRTPRAVVFRLHRRQPRCLLWLSMAVRRTTPIPTLISTPIYTHSAQTAACPFHPYETIYAPAPAHSSFPSAPLNSMRVFATREPRRRTSALMSKCSPTQGRR